MLQRLRVDVLVQIAEAVSQGDIDLAIMGRPGSEDELAATAFARHPSVVVCAPGPASATVERLSVRDLAGERLIIREEGSGTRILMQQVFLAAGIAPLVGMTTDSNETIKQAVMAGMRIAIISRHTIGLEHALRLIHILPVEGFPVMRSWFVVRRRSMPMMPAHTRLQAFIEENGQKVIDELKAGYRAAVHSCG